MNIIEEVILKSGGTQASLASVLGVSDNAVSKWVKRGLIPIARVIEIETKLGIKRELLRPDLFRV